MALGGILARDVIFEPMMEVIDMNKVVAGDYYG
jgi:hypothetical protein